MTNSDAPTTEAVSGKRSNASIYIVLSAIIATLIAGFLLKGQCIGPWDGIQYERLCYNDIQPLYTEREIEAGTFPYINGDPSEGGLSGGAIEYPVLTGLFMWLMGQFVEQDFQAYLVVTSIALAPFGVYAAYRLAKMVGTRALLFAAAPAVVLYAFHNWDLLVVAAVVAAISFWRTDRSVPAAVALGIGGALKMFPLIFLAPLALFVWHRAGFKGGFGEALKVAIAGVGTFLLINLPFMLINLDGWWATYEFHRLRVPNYDSLWALSFSWMSVPTMNLVSGGLTALTFAAVLAYGIRRAGRDGEFPFLPVAGALLASFLLWNKVHSPQYTLWLLPFFALIRVHRLWWLAYTAVDLLVYVGVFRFFYAILYFEADPRPAQTAMEVGVYGRAGLLAALVVIFVTSRRADEPEPEPDEALVSHPAPKVGPVGEQAPA